MEEQKVFYIKPRFWPERENRKPPDDTFLLDDEPSIVEKLRYRQQMRLYYRNWIEVWRTYSYFTNYGVFVIPLIALLAWSWKLFVILAIPFFIFKRHIGNKLWGLNGLRIIIQVMFDKELVQHFGYLPPFEDE
ncbi:MAG: hypothetical protein IH591_15160 [Bacteroidales bacterium]|nr:hypothetical protein [Bacteroidales bacterium]